MSLILALVSYGLHIVCVCACVYVLCVCIVCVCIACACVHCMRLCVRVHVLCNVYTFVYMYMCINILYAVTTIQCHL